MFRSITSDTSEQEQVINHFEKVVDNTRALIPYYYQPPATRNNPTKTGIAAMVGTIASGLAGVKRIAAGRFPHNQRKSHKTSKKARTRSKSAPKRNPVKKKVYDNMKLLPKGKTVKGKLRNIEAKLNANTGIMKHLWKRGTQVYTLSGVQSYFALPFLVKSEFLKMLEKFVVADDSSAIRLTKQISMQDVSDSIDLCLANSLLNIAFMNNALTTAHVDVYWTKPKHDQGASPLQDIENGLSKIDTYNTLTAGTLISQSPFVAPSTQFQPQRLVNASLEFSPSSIPHFRDQWLVVKHDKFTLKAGEGKSVSMILKSFLVDPSNVNATGSEYQEALGSLCAVVRVRGAIGHVPTTGAENRVGVNKAGCVLDTMQSGVFTWRYPAGANIEQRYLFDETVADSKGLWTLEQARPTYEITGTVQ